MKIQLSDHFTFKKLILFTAPSIAMIIFTSIYGIIDGFFVSNFVGKLQFSAVNFIFPFIMILGAVGSMLGSGGSALIAKKFGEGDNEKANSLFSLFVYLTLFSGAIISLLAIIFIEKVAFLLGARGQLLQYSVLYGRILLLALPFQMLMFEFQTFYVTAEKPMMGLLVTIISGITNMLGDFLFIAVFKWELVGAALASVLCQLLGGIIPLIYFANKNGSLLRLGKLKMDLKCLFKACGNGSSEFLTNVSMSLVSMLYNAQLLIYEPENGIATYGILMYLSMIFVGFFLGFSFGTAPLIGYNFGSQNVDELKNLRKKGLFVVCFFSVIMFVLSELLSSPLSMIFAGYDARLFALTKHAFKIFSFSFLFLGFPIFGSSFFTALNDGLTSAIISFLRTLVFQISAVLILPIFFQLDGIWISLIVSEFLATTVFIICYHKNKKKYQY